MNAVITEREQRILDGLSQLAADLRAKAALRDSQGAPSLGYGYRSVAKRIADFLDERVRSELAP